MLKLLGRYGDVLACVLLLVFFNLFPNVDLFVAREFYRPGVGFWLSNEAWVQFGYKVFAKGWIVAVIVILLLAWSYVPRIAQRWGLNRRVLAYLLATVLIGPGLLVHTVLKDHWGRARPVHLQEFGGGKQFTPAGVISDQCDKNCSFVSGHVAIAAFLMAGFWVTRRRPWLFAGIALAAYVGLVRIVMGAHFLSDVVFAVFVVHFTLRLFSPLLKQTEVAAKSPE